eukprot:COSAG05_NODE_13892_length_415_cov_0.743671_1_plen_53_part_00
MEHIGLLLCLRGCGVVLGAVSRSGGVSGAVGLSLGLKAAVGVSLGLWVCPGG